MVGQVVLSKNISGGFAGIRHVMFNFPVTVALELAYLRLNGS